MQTHKIFKLVAIIGFSLSLAACGGTAATPAPNGGDDTDTTVTEEAGDTEDTGDTESSSDLPESASASLATGGTVTVNFPSGWTAQAMDGAGAVILTGAEAGQAITVNFLPSAMASALGDSPSAILSAQSDPLVSVMTGAEVGDVTEVEVGGNPAATRTVSLAGIDTYYYIVSVDGGYAFVYGAGADAATIEAIAASVSFAS